MTPTKTHIYVFHSAVFDRASHSRQYSLCQSRMIFISRSDCTPVNNASVGLLGDVFIDGLGLPDGFYYFQVVERKSITNTLIPATSCVERARLVASLGSQRDLKS
jgi:hypothetical protein